MLREKKKDMESKRLYEKHFTYFLNTLFYEIYFSMLDEPSAIL